MNKFCLVIGMMVSLISQTSFAVSLDSDEIKFRNEIVEFNRECLKLITAFKAATPDVLTDPIFTHFDETNISALSELEQANSGNRITGEENLAELHKRQKEKDRAVMEALLAIAKKAPKTTELQFNIADRFIKISLRAQHLLMYAKVSSNTYQSAAAKASATEKPSIFKQRVIPNSLITAIYALDTNIKVLHGLIRLAGPNFEAVDESFNSLK